MSSEVYERALKSRICKLRHHELHELLPKRIGPSKGHVRVCREAGFVALTNLPGHRQPQGDIEIIEAVSFKQEQDFRQTTNTL